MKKDPCNVYCLIPTVLFKYVYVYQCMKRVGRKYANLLTKVTPLAMRRGIEGDIPFSYRVNFLFTLKYIIAFITKTLHLKVNSVII